MQRPTSRAGPMRLLGSPALIFLAALLTRVCIILVTGVYETPFRWEPRRTAEALVTLGLYGNPYLVPTGPTAHASPVQVLLSAAVFQVFGTGATGELALYTFNAALASCVYALMPFAGRAIEAPPKAVLLAAWFGALVPFHFLNELRSSEATLGAMALMALLSVGRKMLDAPWPTPRVSIAVGLLWGTSLLVLPALLCVIATFVVATLALHWSRRNFGHVMMSCAIAVLVLSPWALRNYLVLGDVVWFRSNFGMELRLSFNDATWPDYERNYFGRSFELYHPLRSLEAAQRVLDEGEIAYNNRLRSEAIDWMRLHPGRVLSLLVQRVSHFWFPRAARGWHSMFLCVLSALALAGWFVLMRRHKRAATVIGLAWLSFPIVYYVLYATVRYRYPMTWTLLVAAASLPVHLHHRLVGALPQQAPRMVDISALHKAGPPDPSRPSGHLSASRQRR